MDNKIELAALGLGPSDIFKESPELAEYEFITENIAKYGTLFMEENEYQTSSTVENILFRFNHKENTLFKVENVKKYIFRIPEVAEKIAEFTQSQTRLAAATIPFKVFNKEAFSDNKFSITLEASQSAFQISIIENGKNYSGILKFIIRSGNKESNVLFNITNGKAVFKLADSQDVISHSDTEFWIAID